MRGLCGLLLNHLHLMRTKYVGIFLLAVPVCLIGYLITNEPVFISFLKMSLVAFIPIYAMDSAHASFVNKWNAFEKSWSISPRLMVLSRYIVFIILNLLCTALWLASPFYGRYEEELFGNTGVFILIAHLTCITYLPIVYLLNPGKVSAATVMFAAAAAGAVLLCFHVVIPLANGSLLFKIVIVAALYVISAALTMIFNSIHRR